MIIFEQVSKQFKRQYVLNQVNFQIQPGEHIALVGSNGAGKTTLMRCLLGEYCCEGKIVIDGLNPRTDRQAVLKRVGFVPQLPPPLKMPVGQLIRFSAGVCGTDSQDIVDITKRLGLDIQTLLHRPFVKLSGGQKQKLLIAIALGRKCDILMMDEPAANLDPKARQIFLELLQEKQEQAITLISSHRLDELAALVNRVLELDRGQVVLDDRVADQNRHCKNWFCRLILKRSEVALTKTLKTWQFTESEAGLIWEGDVAGPERLHFLTLLSRHAEILNHVSLE